GGEDQERGTAHGSHRRDERRTELKGTGREERSYRYRPGGGNISSRADVPHPCLMSLPEQDYSSSCRGEPFPCHPTHSPGSHKDSRSPAWRRTTEGCVRSSAGCRPGGAI